MISEHRTHLLVTKTSAWTHFAALLAWSAALLPAAVFAESYSWRNVEIVGGGYVPGIVFNTTEPNLIYARTDIGGAYRWNQTTQRWIPLLDWVSFDDWNLTGVDSLATDAVDPNRLYVLAGTYTNLWTSQNGEILRSTDRGNTFQRTPLPFKSGGNMPGRGMGERLAIDPNRNATLYLGARSGNGLWRSTDFGVTWARVTSFPATGTYVQSPTDPNGYTNDPVGVVWIVFDKATGTPGNTTQTIYVGVADVGSSIYRSTDGGATWSALPGQPIGFLPHHAVIASTGFMYITYNNNAGPYDGSKGDVWKYSLATGAWTLISPVPSTSADDYFGYGGLAVDAQNPDTIMVAALNSWWPDTILFRSLNGGTTWTRIWDWAGYPNRTLRYTQNITASPWLVFTDTNPIPPVPSPRLGWMIGDLEIDPFNSNRLMYGTGATIYGADNLTAWDTGGQIAITVKAQGLEETAVLALLSPSAGPALFSGLGDINGFRHDSLTVAPARMFSTPAMAVTSLDFAPLTPNFVCRVGNNSTAGVTHAGFSFDSGANWFQASSEPGGANGGTIAAAADASRVVWSPNAAAPHFSTTTGSAWTPCVGLPTGAIVESDRVNPLKFYGGINGTFYVSTNGGATFTATMTGLPTRMRFEAVPGREGDIWLAGSTSGLWHSTNSGTSFTQLANIAVAENIALGMAAPGQTYPALYTSGQVGTVRGFYRSTDAGVTWVRINDDQHQYGHTGGAIAADPRVFGRMFIATNGRGVIWGEPSGILTPDFSLSAAPATLTVNRGASGTSTIAIARTGGFTGSVDLSASGLPTGVTAVFAPDPTTAASSVLTLSASATATLGAATVTINGVGTPGTRSTTISLTVGQVVTPDFSLSAAPATLTVNRGASGTSTITIARTGGFTGSVDLGASGLPTGVTAAFAPDPTTGASSVLTLSASATATLGAATITINGVGTPGTRSTTIALTIAQLPVPNFTLAATPASLSIAGGASGTSTIAITRTGGFTGAVDLSATAPAGWTVAFTPDPAPGNSSIMTVTVPSTAAAGSFTITVSGTAPGVTGSGTATVAVQVPPAGLFTIFAAFGNQTVNRGASVTNTITINRLNFPGSVALSISGLPAGVTGTFSPNPTTANSSVLTFTAALTAPLGTTPITVTGTSGTFTPVPATINLTVGPAQTPDFSLTAAPATLTVNRGASGTSTITIARTGGFAGSVDLSTGALPTGVTAAFSVDPTTGTSSVLTLSASATATLGAATVTINGVGTPGTRSTTVSLTVANVPPTPCSNPVPITLSFAKDGAGEFCWVTSGNINFVNFWNLQLLEVNGVTLTQWTSGANLPPRINGNYYIHYIGNFPWSHFEANGSP